MGVKYAKAMGAEVTVFSHSPEKREDALAMGATHFVAKASKEDFKRLAKNFDLILNTVSVDLNLEDYLGMLKLDGTLVLIGLPGGSLQCPSRCATWPTSTISRFDDWWSSRIAGDVGFLRRT